MNGRIARPHLGQHFLARNAAIHDPNALRLAILGLDLLQKAAQGCLVAGIARHDFIGKGKTFRCDHQRDDHLHTVGPLVAAIAVLALVVFGKGWIALEVSAREIIKQHLEARIKEIFPALLQMTKERAFMLQQ